MYSPKMPKEIICTAELKSKTRINDVQPRDWWGLNPQIGRV